MTHSDLPIIICPANMVIKMGRNAGLCYGNILPPPIAADDNQGPVQVSLSLSDEGQMLSITDNVSLSQVGSPTLYFLLCSRYFIKQCLLSMDSNCKGL